MKLRQLVATIYGVILVTAGKAWAEYSAIEQQKQAMDSYRRMNPLSMMHGNQTVFFLAAIPLILGVWYVVIVTDKARVRNHFEGEGCKIINISWRLFGHGWMAESHEGGGNRIYLVDYTDAAGNTKSAWCKTAWLGGVYLAGDKIVKPGPARAPLDKDAEIKRLRAENEALKRQQQQ